MTPCLTVFTDRSKAVFLLLFSLFFCDWHQLSSCFFFYKSSFVYWCGSAPGTISLTGSVGTTVNITQFLFFSVT